MREHVAGGCSKVDYVVMLGEDDSDDSDDSGDSDDSSDLGDLEDSEDSGDSEDLGNLDDTVVLVEAKSPSVMKEHG
jgi:hypothetical protein